MLIDLDAIYAASPSPHVLLDRDLRIVWANDAYLAVTDRSRERLIGRIMTEEFPAPPDSIADRMLRGSFQRVLDSGKADHLPLIPYPIVAADGTETARYWSATHTPVLDETGAVQYLLQNTNDVTPLYVAGGQGGISTPIDRATMIQRAEAVTLQNLELGSVADFFRTIFDQAPSFIAILSGPDHVFQLTNKAYMQLVGRSDLLGQTVRAGLPDLEGQGFYELLDEVYRSGVAVAQSGAAVRFRDSSDSGGDAPQVLRFVDFIFQPLRDRAGNTTGIFVQGHEVTRQKLAELELYETRERFRVMAQSMPNHVWTATADGALDWLNDQAYAYTGRAEGELYGDDWAHALHPEDLASAGADWANAVAQGVPYQTEFRIRRHDGAYRWHIVRASPIRSAAGEVQRWVGSNTDIEDRKLHEAAVAEMNQQLEDRVAERNRELEMVNAALRQSQKMEAIGNLAGGIAHDFNNLLQTISGSLQLAMRKMDSSSEVMPRVTLAMKAVERGATLASQLLSFGRRQPLAPKVVNLGRMLRDADNIIRSAIGEAIEVETVVAGGLWNTCVDLTNVESAVLNMAINGRDAMEGHGKLTIEVGNADLDDAYARRHLDVVPGQYVMLAVTDTGSGMSPEVIERVFDPFFTTKPEGRGTGLGMSMVYGFVKQSGGHIKIYSELGSGTSVKIYLPRSLDAEELPAKVPHGALAGGHETILLVEDDEDVRSTAASLLDDLGYTVLQARDADRALAVIESGARIDLLFTDVVMPGKITSRELADRARQVIPQLPVLFTSGYTRNSIVHGGRLDPGVQLLSKPYTQEQLALKIHEVLGKPESERAQLADPDAPQGPAGAPSLSDLRVLVCEDEVLIRMDMVDALTEQGCKVQGVGLGAQALGLLAAEPFDLLIVDLGLPDMSGVEVARRAVAQVAGLRVIFATGERAVSGADDVPNHAVLGKPFSDFELTDTILAVLARRE
ncbi:ATPase [Cypionkella aquatica]|uniref:histidine kinase n=1 Tax=Cypionkella aquatica TaxID=1756042 RepID=A0AA37X1Z6_9RHOB|nr:response regulator [Cypionkella aquatica]GLS87095.1 ATPase [Cypionkella aquatica]